MVKTLTLSVSILVLVDLARELCPTTVTFSRNCFNPCFSGSCSRISLKAAGYSDAESFNPCFSGSCSRILELLGHNPQAVCVSILVLVDLARELYIALKSQILECSFNPCFSGSCSRINAYGV